MTELLKNFYLNKGYYNVVINSSFAKMTDDKSFELIFNIDANPKLFFGDRIECRWFSKSNYEEVGEFLRKLKDKPYSINRINDIVEKIESITINEQYESIKVSINENIVSNKINISFKIEETKNFSLIELIFLEIILLENL